MLTQDAIKTTQDIANRFHELAQTGRWNLIQDEMYAENAESFEPANSPWLKSVKGLEAIKQKGLQISEIVEEMHGEYSNEPQVAGNHFAVEMGMDVTIKGQGRLKIDEIALYEVNDGEIIKEQFFY